MSPENSTVSTSADIELTISVESTGLVRASLPSGSESEDSVDLDQLHRQMIELFDDWVRDKRLRYRHEFELFGALLWRSLFPPEVAGLLDDALRQAQDEKARVRIQLVFREGAAELAQLPWEYTYRPSTPVRAGWFLATSPDVVLSRYLPLETAREALAPEDPPLRVLVASSKPADLGPVLTPDTVAAIRELEDGGSVEVSELPVTSLTTLMDTVKATQPHVVHFMGHGEYVPGSGGRIALVGDDGNADWFDDKSFAELFVSTKAIPRLAFLHLCEGGASEYKEDFAGLAPQLVRHGVQAVVAMQYPISNRTAITVSRQFYSEVAAGATIDHAVQQARMNVSLAGKEDTEQRRDFGAPVLYMRSRSGVLKP